MKGSVYADAHLTAPHIAGDNNVNSENVGTDKYALKLNTSLKDVKMLIAKESEDNRVYVQQNKTVFNFIPIFFGLGNRVSDR